MNTNRWPILTLMTIFFALVFLSRLFDLQIIQGSYFRLLADGNRIRHIPIKAPRGEILDRNGVVLARNAPVYKLATFNRGGIVEKTEEVSREEAIKIQVSEEEFANRLITDNEREYPLGEVTAHVVGFVNEATGDEVAGISNFQCPISNELASQGASFRSWQAHFELGDLVGRMGVEQYYDCILRGVNGEDLIEVDARGRLVRRLGRKEPIAGKTIKLSIDSGLQKSAYEALLSAPDEKGLPRKEGEVVKGAIVAENPQNGEILVLISLPSYNPNKLHEDFVKISQDQNLPFFNRAIAGVYHPGSTFKIVTSAAALQEGVIDENYKYVDVGFVEAGGTRFRNWLFSRNGGQEGEIDLVRAITRSTDTFFYIAGDLVGIDNLVKWANLFGIGKRLGIDLPGEEAGLMPTPDWKIKTFDERWFLGNTYNTSIGQGDVTATPLQIAGITAVVANGGRKCVPQVSQVPQVSRECMDIGLNKKTIRLIKDGMVGACSPGGTAGQFFNFEPRTACKTGTAEVGNDKTHAWFTAFAPVDNPEIVITAVVEEGGEGSTVAAPVVKKVMSKYFEK